MLVWMVGVAMAGEGLFLPDAAHAEAMSGEVSVGLGVGDPQDTMQAIPVGRASFSPVQPLRLEVGYGKVLGDAGALTASVRYQLLRGETWAVAPWVGGAWLPDEGIAYPAAGLAFSVGSERVRLDVSIPIVLGNVEPLSPVGPGALLTEATLGWTPVEGHTLRVGTSTLLAGRMGYEFRQDTGLLLRADGVIGVEGTLGAAASVGFAW